MTEPPIRPMDVDELHQVAGEDLCWGSAALSRAAGARDTTTARWWSGARTVPLPIAAWLRRLAALHRDNPSPVAPPYIPAQTDE